MSARLPCYVAVIVLFAGARYAHWSIIEHRFTTISADRLFHSADMPADDLLELVRDRRIRSVVDLRSAGEGALSPAAERQLLEGRGVRYHHFPSDRIPSDATIASFVDIARDPGNLPVLVHCHHGEGRSVLLAAIYRIEIEGWTNEEARRAAKVLHFRGAFGPRGEKGRFLRAYQSRLRTWTEPPGDLARSFAP